MEVVGPALSPEDGPSAGHEPPILPWPSRGSGSSTAMEARTSSSWCWSLRACAPLRSRERSILQQEAGFWP